MIWETVPRATKAAGGSSSGIHVGRSRTGATLAEVWRNVGGTASARSVTGGGVLGLVEGKVSHLQTVGHFCG